MYDPNKITYFAETDFRNQRKKFGIKAADRQKHMYVIGKTGMGKSTMLENMAVQDIQNGEGMAFIDPHGGTAEKLLDYVPEERKNDVIYFAPFDMDYPISFNIMEDVGYDKRHLVVSGLMSVFEKIWADAWSARMSYILQNTLFALLEYPDSTLLDINRVLIDKDFRKKVVDNVTDPSVKSFWVDEFAKYTDRYTQDATPAIQNKVGQFASNPLVRNIIGQPKSSFDIRHAMDEKKILIMNLSKGRIGDTNTRLLGSMLITKIYLSAMSRADLSDSELKVKPNFYFFVDEFQSFANKSFADILSEARKYKLNLTIAHQYVEQMEEEVRSAVFGNVGTMIVFRVGSFDAEIFEKEFAPTVMAEDIVNLGFAQIYLRLMIDGIGSKPFSAVTLPPITPPEYSTKNEVVEASRKQFGRSRQDVEGAIIKRLEKTKEEEKPREKTDERPRSPRPSRRDNEGREQGREKNRESERFPDRSFSDRRDRRPPRDFSPREEQETREQKPVSLDVLKKKKQAELASQNKNQLKEALSGILEEQKKDEPEPKSEQKNEAPPKSPPESEIPEPETVSPEKDKNDNAHQEKTNDDERPKEIPERELRDMLK